MEEQRRAIIEIWLGLLLIVIGLIVWGWFRQLLWIMIYPPSLAKQLIESLPFVLWGLGTLFIIDGVRRKIKDSPPN